MSEKEFEYPTVESLAEGVEQDRANVAILLGKLGTKSVENFNFPGMRQLPPPVPGAEKKYTPESIRERDALLQFFYAKHGEHGVAPSIFVSEGYVGKLHSMFIRFVITDEVLFTYVCQHENYDNVIELLTDPDVMSEGNWVDHLLFRNQRYWQFRDQRGDTYGVPGPIELPLSWLSSPFESELDGLLNGDFDHYDEVVEKFGVEFREKLAEATHLAQKVGYLIAVKDHDLYLSFKGVDKLTRLNIGLDRVYPLLPEEGSVSLGDKVLSVDDWKGYVPGVQVSVKRLITANKKINRMIDKYHAMLPDHPVIQAKWVAELKTQLMASSHFMKVIYSFSADYGMKLVQEVANDVLTKLHDHGGNIGLDLNDWTVYSYEGIGRPTPVVTPELKFTDLLYKRYTTSFIDALYAYLLRCQSPLIKPYTYREVISQDDGIAIGTIRQA